MHCPNCHTLNQDKALFCLNCMARISLIRPGARCCNDHVIVQEQLREEDGCTCFAAEDLPSGKPCVLREFYPLSASDVNAKRRFSRVVKRLMREGEGVPIIPLINYQTSGNYFYTVEEALERTSLRECVTSNGPLPVEVATRILERVLAGIQALHTGDPTLIHGDLNAGVVFWADEEPSILISSSIFIGQAINGAEPGRPEVDLHSAGLIGLELVCGEPTPSAFPEEQLAGIDDPEYAAIVEWLLWDGPGRPAAAAQAVELVRILLEAGRGQPIGGIARALACYEAVYGLPVGTRINCILMRIKDEALASSRGSEAVSAPTTAAEAAPAFPQEPRVAEVPARSSGDAEPETPPEVHEAPRITDADTAPREIEPSEPPPVPVEVPGDHETPVPPAAPNVTEIVPEPEPIRETTVSPAEEPAPGKGNEPGDLPGAEPTPEPTQTGRAAELPVQEIWPQPISVAEAPQTGHSRNRLILIGALAALAVVAVSGILIYRHGSQIETVKPMEVVIKPPEKPPIAIPQADEKRKKDEEAVKAAEQKKLGEEAVKAAEQKKLGEEAVKAAEQKKLAEEAVKTAEQKKLAEKRAICQALGFNETQCANSRWVVQCVESQWSPETCRVERKKKMDSCQAVLKFDQCADRFR